MCPNDNIKGADEMERELLAEFDPEQSYKDFLRRMEEGVCVPRPMQLKLLDLFIGQANKLAEEYGVEVEIEQKSYFVQANIHMPYSYFYSDFTRSLAALMSMCDSMSTFKPKDSDGFLISLDYHTHDFYFGGRLINPE